ncbi:MAG: hypothetical protein IKF52_02525 [Clostridia bacterium]|nr:hypothetical protein [Clostridia bacterium]
MNNKVLSIFLIVIMLLFIIDNASYAKSNITLNIEGNVAVEQEKKDVENIIKKTVIIGIGIIGISVTAICFAIKKHIGRKKRLEEDIECSMSNRKKIMK